LHEVDETIEEWLSLEISVVSFEMGLRGLNKLHSKKLESLLFESLNDGSDETSLHTIRLDHNEGLVFVAYHLCTG
jgi:hypothetical protein